MKNVKLDIISSSENKLKGRKVRFKRYSVIKETRDQKTTM